MPAVLGLYYFVSPSDSTSSPPVILIHGVGGSHLSWPPEVRRLSGQAVYALDLPGHGKSEAPGEQSVGGYAQKAIEWMEEMEIYRAHLVGHSMGGAIALDMAAKIPNRVVGLCLLSVGAPLKVPREILESVLNPLSYKSALSKIISLSFSPEANPRLVELVSKRLHESRPGVLKGDLLACDGFLESGQNMLAQIKSPVLVLTGAKDEMVPLRRVQFLASQIPNAELSVMPEAGHMIMLERPAEVASQLARFLHRRDSRL